MRQLVAQATVQVEGDHPQLLATGDGRWLCGVAERLLKPLLAIAVTPFARDAASQDPPLP